MVRIPMHQSRIIEELSSILLRLLRYPSSDPSHAKIPPSGFASLIVGVSLSMMLCGSITFLIGFMLLPWVIGLVMVMYVVGVVSSASVLCRALLCFVAGLASPPRKDVTEWKLL